MLPNQTSEDEEENEEQNEEQKEGQSENEKGEEEQKENRKEESEQREEEKTGEQKDEKLKFLKREEIRTMHKEVAMLREIEAQKERERIAGLQSKEETSEVKKVPETKRIVEVKKIQPSTFRFAKISFIKKILVRTTIVVVLFFAIGFFYWASGANKSETLPEKITPSQEEIPLEEKTEEVEKEEIPKIVIWPALFPVTATATLETPSLAEFSELLSQSFQEDTLTRILIKNPKENKILGLKEFFELFEIKAPAALFNKLNNNFTLFVYSSQGINRLGFATKIEQEQELINLLNSWEPSMEQDTEELFKVLGKQDPALASSFKEAVREEVAFRFLTISKADFGICYASIDDYFVFTTSFGGMEKAIEKIKKEGKKIGQLFMIGFEGKIITSQLEETFKKYHPGGILLLTKNIENEKQLKDLTKGLQALSLKETGFPLFIAIDQEGTISRINFADEKTFQSDIEDSRQAFQIGKERAEELKELGINLNLAPVLDITKEEDFLFSRSFQKDPNQTGDLAEALVLGQKTAGILTAIKHFPGYGGINFNPEEELAEQETLPETFQFKKTLEINPEFVMVSNLIYKDINPSLPFSFSSEGIQFLKNNLGENVLIISDDLDQNSLLEKFSLKEIIAKPIEAGVDILLFSGYRLPAEQGLCEFFRAVKNNEISKEKIDETISKIIKLKEKSL